MEGEMDFWICLGLIIVFIAVDAAFYAAACERDGSQIEKYGRWVMFVPGSGFFCFLRSR
jgi:hypothetical protein